MSTVDLRLATSHPTRQHEPLVSHQSPEGLCPLRNTTTQPTRVDRAALVSHQPLVSIAQPSCRTNHLKGFALALRATRQHNHSWRTSHPFRTRCEGWKEKAVDVCISHICNMGFSDQRRNEKRSSSPSGDYWLWMSLYGNSRVRRDWQ